MEDDKILDVADAADAWGCRVCWIERPIPSYGHIHFVPDNLRDIERAKASWPFFHLYRVWGFGINREELVKWFDSIPPDITAISQRILLTLQRLIIKRSEFLTSADHSIQATPSLLFDDPIQNMETSDEMGDFCASESFAYTLLEYDSSTQERRSAYSNRRGPSIEHMHREEYLARMASHDLPISMPAFDFLCYIMDDVLRYSEQRLERCFRMNKWDSVSGNSGGAMLFHSTTIRSFDAVGRISKV
jgi:hypothetical protein